MENKKLLIVGGVAGGASCAARARRLSEHAEIIIFERGAFVSFANCGLPYYVGNVITKEEKLLVASPKLFRDRFIIEVRTESNVRQVFPGIKEIEVEDLKTGKIYRESYDALVLAPGSETFKPEIEGINLPGIFTSVTIPDSRRIIAWIKTKNVKHAAIIGGGFIGLEMTENLKKLEIQVSIVEMQPHVLPTLDREMAAFVHDHLERHGISLYLGSPLAGFKENETGGISVVLENGRSLATDMVVLSMGVRPRTELARTAGLAIGERGGILVDEMMQTSDRNIWAVGDAVEVRNIITARQNLVPLAGPANRQGRIAADAILGQNQPPHYFRGVQATAVCGVLGLTVASTGVTEKVLRALGIDSDSYEKIYLHPNDHAGYYPDAQTITLKLIFGKKNGRIYGAQAVGKAGVEKRIDVIAMAIQRESTVFDLEEAELCYAPQYGSAKDPVNLAGMIAANVLRGHVTVGHWENLPGSNSFILDVRNPDEFEKGHVENALNIPLNELRSRLSTLPRDREIWAYCQVGLRSYFAVRVLKQKGFDAHNVSGGFRMYGAVRRFKEKI
jgi:NADPH-dependent 2,4-dienoyl-CoA reductase/sulfur reductase-like enzyme/rhodanese-related sulfurtransferase